MDCATLREPSRKNTINNNRDAKAVVDTATFVRTLLEGEFMMSGLLNATVRLLK
jgi:hypothetical protein